ncbi:hypothetical protein [Terasakiella sp. SH-1]|uniref:bifunctional folylpolyglutamate synthase/dihydrofolate synthase n=1 Tax=Terasakiella sp. SH-1 TaxID=2560057 RepID=UPI00107497FA|nr:hypothetical protein [Terasakiella sp. SH-1]
MKTHIEQLANLPQYGDGIGFVRMQALLDRLNITPKCDISLIGTNGKGSTALYCTELLKQKNLTVGTYTSPHFLEPNERIRINGTPIALTQLNDLIGEVMQASQVIAKEKGYTFVRFEILTAAAWLCFQRHDVSCQIIEAGIGGRLDTTRIAMPRLTVLPSLELEHTSVLGTSLDQILVEKIAITAPKGCCLANLPPETRLVQTGGHIAKMGGFDWQLLKTRWTELSFDLAKNEARGLYDGQEVHLRPAPIGQWQIENSALAVTACDHLLQQRQMTRLSQNEIDCALSQTQIPGRGEVVHDSPKFIVESAHTPCAMKEVVSYINATYQPDEFIVLCGISKPKAVVEIVQELSELPVDFYVTTSLRGGEQGEIIAGYFREQGKETSLIPDIYSAVQQVKDIAQREQKTVFVLGSLFFSADVTRILKGISPDDAVYL